MVRGFKKKLGEGLICLVVVGIVIGLSLAMGRREREAGGVGKTGGVSKGVKLREVELMMEYEFKLEGPNVQVIFDEKECSVFKARKLGARGLEKRKASEVVKILYPRIVMDLKLVKFLDERGNIVKRIPLRHDEKFVKDGKKMYASDMAYISRNGEYVGISSFESDLSLRRNVKEEFTLLDNSGEVIWRKEITGHAIQNCKISDDGTRVLLVDEGIGRGEFPEIVPGFYIYGKGGIQVAQQKFDGTLRNVVMSRNGKYVAGILTTGNIEGKTPPWQDFLVFYDIDKRKGWRYKLDGRIAISERGDVVVSGRDECVYSFTKEGELKWKHQIGDTNVRISDNGALVQARVFPSMEFYLYDNRNGNLLWKIDGPIKLPNNEHMQPFSIGLSREGNCVRLLNRPEKGEPLVFCILSLKKEIVEWTKLNLPQGLGRCSAFTSYDGKFLHVKSGYKPVRWFIYSLK